MLAPERLTVAMRVRICNPSPLRLQLSSLIQFRCLLPYLTLKQIARAPRALQTCVTSHIRHVLSCPTTPYMQGVFICAVNVESVSNGIVDIFGDCVETSTDAGVVTAKHTMRRAGKIFLPQHRGISWLLKDWRRSSSMDRQMTIGG